MSDEPRMTGMDKEIFNATRTLTSLLNNACNHWNYLCPYLERLAVVADDALRGYQKDYPEQVAELIDYRRKRDSQSNAAAMREALVLCSRIIGANGIRGNVFLDDIQEAHRAITAALSAPPRQCDVGTAEEHAQRFYNFCESNSSGINGMCKQTCPCIDCFDKCQCLAKWAQMPYGAEEGGAE